MYQCRGSGNCFWGKREQKAWILCLIKLYMKQQANLFKEHRLFMTKKAKKYQSQIKVLSKHTKKYQKKQQKTKKAKYLIAWILKAITMLTIAMTLNLTKVKAKTKLFFTDFYKFQIIDSKKFIISCILSLLTFFWLSAP